jgi:hypothetical protein
LRQPPTLALVDGVQNLINGMHAKFNSHQRATKDTIR